MLVSSLTVSRPATCPVQNPWLSCARVPLGYAKNEPAPADVAGYSRGIDEEGVLAALKACQEELIDPKMTDVGGIVFWGMVG